MNRILFTTLLAGIVACANGCASNQANTNEGAVANVPVRVRATDVTYHPNGQCPATSPCSPQSCAATNGNPAANTTSVNNGQGISRTQLRAQINETIANEVKADSNLRVTVAERVDDALLRAGSGVRTADGAVNFARQGQAAIEVLHGNAAPQGGVNSGGSNSGGATGALPGAPRRNP